MEKAKETKKHGMFTSILDSLIVLPNLKLLNLSISFLKGFEVKIEFFENRGD